MVISSKKIKIIKLKNRKGFAAICLDHLTEGKTILQAYQRMEKALKRNKIEVKAVALDVKKLITSL